MRLNAPNQTINGTPYTWRSWSDGLAQSHSVVTPNTATTYTANFATN
jgi:hypothetical protein